MELYKKVNEGNIHAYSFKKGLEEEKTEDKLPTSSKGSTFGSNSNSTINMLRYMPSEEFVNDYYNPDNEREDTLENALGEDQKIKQIQMPITQNLRAKANFR